MNRREELDAHVHSLMPVRDQQLAPLADSEGSSTLLDEITATPLWSKTGKSRRRRLLRAPVLVGLGVALAGGATALALTLPGTSLDKGHVACRTAPRAVTGIHLKSGNAIHDCAVVWRQLHHGHPAPKLRAYEDRNGLVTVEPAAWTPPRGATPLSSAQTHSNLKVIELRESLNDDTLAGLQSGCYDDAAATRIVQRELRRLHLTGWSVQPPSRHANGATSCIFYAKSIDVSTRTIALGNPGGAEGIPTQRKAIVQLWDRLRAIEQRCLSLPVAERQIKQAAASLGFTAKDFIFTRVHKNAHCTVIHADVGGAILITLRGPAR